MVSFPKVFSALWDKLEPREREVIAGRFGLDKSGKRQTLAALGNRYGVTRERVRQIESSALATLRGEIAASPACAEFTAKSRKYLKESGGVAKKEQFIRYARSFVDGLTENHLGLFLEASRAFHAHPEDGQFWSFYYLDRESFKLAVNFINQWAQTLKGKKEHALAGRYEECLKNFLKQKSVSETHAGNYLGISKRVGGNSYGDLGLTEWPEIQPRTIRDRIYLVLKKDKEPLHFKIIARAINENGSGKRRASAPTVHNELIKDERFVLVGRGIYALQERGYEPGTAREVIHRVLKRQGGLRAREIVLAIQKERFFKPNTILVNLQNKSFFRRMPDGTYHVREA